VPPCTPREHECQDQLAAIFAQRLVGEWRISVKLDWTDWRPGTVLYTARYGISEWATPTVPAWNRFKQSLANLGAF